MDQSLKRSIAYQIACGMYYLVSSSPPIFHRDLKSQNVLLDVNKKVKLTDFGLSRVKIHTLSQMSKVGTPQWSAVCKDLLRKNFVCITPFLTFSLLYY